MTLVKHKWDDLDLVVFNVIGGRVFMCYLVHLFVMHDNVLTASVSVIKQRVKAHGPLVLDR